MPVSCLLPLHRCVVADMIDIIIKAIDMIVIDIIMLDMIVIDITMIDIIVRYNNDTFNDSEKYNNDRLN